jgi:adenylosuccinate lyase
MLAVLVGTVPELKVAMDKMPKAQLDEFVDLAVQKEITDMAKVDAIKQKTGKDVIKLVQFNRQLKEEPKAEN